MSDSHDGVDAGDKPDIPEETRPPLGPGAIDRRIPHRYPFSFVDRVTVCEPGSRAEGYKMVTRNEWFFAGHFPGRPLLPGVITVEALAQLAAVCFSGLVGENEGVGVLTGIDKLKFRRQVVPGDQLDLRVKMDRRRGPFVRVVARASVDGETAAEGILSFVYTESEGNLEP